MYGFEWGERREVNLKYEIRLVKKNYGISNGFYRILLYFYDGFMHIVVLSLKRGC